MLLKSGDHVLVGDDVYGGTFRIFDKVMKQFGIDATFLDMSDASKVKTAMRATTKLVWMETPSNPMLKIFDIAKIAAVKDDDRGMVITLQGEVLFKTGKWDLKPGAMAKLDQIADALRGKEQPMVVYGFTDNVGAVDMNMDLSQKRAQSVRDYLASKGIPGDLITAEGKGPAAPVASTTCAP